MTTLPDPTGVHPVGMIDNQDPNTVFLKALIDNPRIEVGEYTYYNDWHDPTRFESQNVLYMIGPERLRIGKFCAFAMGAKFVMSAANHPMLGTTTFPFFVFGGTWLERTAECLPQVPSAGDTVIGNDVWIGRDAVVLPGVTVGDGAIVGGYSVVTRDVAPYTIVAGNPARPVRQRFADEDVERMLRIAWWNWPVEAITEHVRTIWTGTPAELERVAREAGLLA